jgi:DNA-binding transcriptional LysR family regulator
VADAVGNLQEPLRRLANWDRLRPSELCRRRWCITLTDVGTMLEACLAGYGIAQVMGFGIADLLEKGRLVELFPDWHDEMFPLHAYRPSRQLPPAKVIAFLDFVDSIIRESAGVH